MKKLLHTCIWLAAPTVAFSQTLIDSAEFFDNEFRARRPGSGGFLNVGVNNAIYRNTPETRTQGNVTWRHGAGGFIQAGVAVVGNVQLASFAETNANGDSLVFGREITTSGALNLLEGALNTVLGASVLASWSSQATVENLMIAPDQLYEVRFSVTSGANVPVDFLSSMNFGITNPQISGASGENAQLVNLLGLVTLGTGSESTGDFAFQFRSSTALDSLTFDFEAASTVNLGLLGGVAGNQNVLTFSGFEVVAVPEPGSAALSALGGLLILRRRRRH